MKIELTNANGTVDKISTQAAQFDTTLDLTTCALRPLIQGSSWIPRMTLRSSTAPLLKMYVSNKEKGDLLEQTKGGLGKGIEIGVGQMTRSHSNNLHEYLVNNIDKMCIFTETENQQFLAITLLH